MPSTSTEPTTTPDADGCVLETYEARGQQEAPGDGSLGPLQAVYVCRSHGWTQTGPHGDDARGAALVASHKAALSGRVLNVDAGALVVEVRDPSLYEHPDLVEGLRAAVGARTVIGIDPAAMELYVTPDDAAREATRQALDGLVPFLGEGEAAAKLLERLKAAGYYLVRVDPKLAEQRQNQAGRAAPVRRGRGR